MNNRTSRHKIHYFCSTLRCRRDGHRRKKYDPFLLVLRAYTPLSDPKPPIVRPEEKVDTAPFDSARTQRGLLGRQPQSMIAEGCPDE